MNAIPLIDFAACGLDAPSNIKNEDFDKVGCLLVNALSTCGFAYLKNSGIQKSSVDKVNEVTKQFFLSPIEDKKRYARSSENNFGYFSIMEETLNPSRPGDYKEAFNIQGYSLCDSTRNWPLDLSPQFKPTIQEFMEKCKQLSFHVLKAMAVGMDLKDEDYFTKSHSLIHKKDNQTTLRTLFYPPLPEDMEVDQIRLGEHSDYGSITLLFQDNIGGLQIQTNSGDYIDAVPIDDTVVINIGDLLQFWSKNRLKSTKHRVINPDDPAKRNVVRRSLVYFVHPDDTTLVDAELLYKDPALNKKAVVPSKRLTAWDYLQERFAATY